MGEICGAKDNVDVGGETIYAAYHAIWEIADRCICCEECAPKSLRILDRFNEIRDSFSRIFGKELSEENFKSLIDARRFNAITWLAIRTLVAINAVKEIPLCSICYKYLNEKVAEIERIIGYDKDCERG